MKCAKCGCETEPVSHEGIEVDRCTACGGLWFDMAEAEHLRGMKGSETIDTGDAAEGRQFDAMRRIKCPKCGEPMLQMVDPRQPHIRFESCPLCYGMFFDAGEFRDLKQETVLDFFRDVFRRKD